MPRTLCNPQRFLGRFRIIKAINHLGRYESVAVAVNEQHRLPTTLHLLDSRGLSKAPPVSYFTQYVAGVQDGEWWQSELIAQLTLELFPRTRISAVGNKTDIDTP